MSKVCVIVEGHGEVEAVGNLLFRLAHDLGLDIRWGQPRRWKNLHQWESAGRGGIKSALNLFRNAPIDGLLILRDEDDLCPANLAPDVASKIAAENLPFPVSYVLLHPEYEVLFLPCLDLFPDTLPDGRACIAAGTTWDHNSWEAKRGIKEWLSKHYPKGTSYKPTLDQLPLTRLIDFGRIRSSNVACFGSLENGMKFLSQNTNRPKAVYPPPKEIR